MKDIIAQAEKAVMDSASKRAYEITDVIENPAIRKRLYTIYRESIIFGARLMQEEMNRIINKK